MRHVIYIAGHYGVGGFSFKQKSYNISVRHVKVTLSCFMIEFVHVALSETLS